MTMEKYKELTDSMLDEYCKIWPEWDITIPSYEEAQTQEQERLLVENKSKENEKMKVMKIENLEETIKDIFSGSEREELDRKIYYEEVAKEDAAKERLKNFTLSPEQKTLLDEACGVEKEEINHSLDEDFVEAFGSTRSVDRLKELKESIGSESEGRELLESVKIDLMDSGSNGVFRFSGRAFQTDVVNSNGRRYSRSIAESALRENGGGTLSVISGHPQPNDTDPSRVVGKVTFSDSLDSAGWVTFEAQLSDTSLGKDLQILLRDKTIGDVSLRSRGKTKQITVDGETIEEVTSLRFKGLDLVREGSFSGAQVDRIFN